MTLDADEYRAAATERLAQAALLFDLPADQTAGVGERRYALVLYLAGLAAECMLRAHRWRANTTFNARHDLKALYDQSELAPRLLAVRSPAGAAVAGERVRTLNRAVSQLNRAWRNEFRFAADAVLVHDFLRRGIIARGRNKGGKASVLRAAVRNALVDATTIVTAGDEAWT